MSALLVVWAAGVWALVAITVWWTALLRRHRAGRARIGCSKGRPGRPLLLVRPCAGDEPGLLECLVSVSQSGEGRALHVVLGMSEDACQAAQTLHRARKILTERGIFCEIVVCPRRGPNRKASILAGSVARAPKGCQTLVCADSNVDLRGVDLFALEACLRRSRTLGCVWRPPVEKSAGALGNRLSAALLHGSLHAFALLGALDRKGMVGKLFAVRLCALAEIGGFEGLADYLGEDVELARRLREAGWTVAFDPTVASTACGPKSLSEAVDRQHRWMMVVRSQRPWLLATYPALFFPLPFIGGLCACGLDVGWVAAAPIGAALGMRLFLGRQARRYSGFPAGPVSWLVDLLLSDAALFWAWGRALRGRQVVWRGNAFHLAAGGRILEGRDASR